MKKLLVLAMMVTMVMGFSFATMANGLEVVEGTLGDWEDTEVKVEIDAEVHIGDYVRITVLQDKTWFVQDRDEDPLEELILSGKRGLYSNDGAVFQGMMNAAFGNFDPIDEDLWIETGDTDTDNNTNLGRIMVETNAPIDIEFTWKPTNWLNSPTVFGVFDRTRLDDGVEGQPPAGSGLTQTDYEFNKDALPSFLDDATGNASLGPTSAYVAFFGNAQSTIDEVYPASGLLSNASVRQYFVQCTPRQYDIMMGLFIEKLTQQEAGKYFGTIDITVSDPGIPV